MRVVIGIISGHLARYSLFSSSMMSLKTPANTALAWQMGTNPAENRNTIIRKHADTADYIWFVDDDHVIPSDTLVKLLAHRVDLVAPLCLLKEPPFHSNCFDTWDDTIRQGRPLELTPAHKGLQEVEAVGAAGLLVRTKVLHALTDPWFELGQMGNTEAMAEDTRFIRKAKAAGFRCFVDFDAPIGHIRTVPVWPHVDEHGTWTTEFRVNKVYRLFIETAHYKKEDPA